MANEKSKLTTMGEIREAVSDALVRVAGGTLPHNDARAIVGLANQITGSVTAEMKYQQLCAALGQKVSELGKLHIGG